MTKRVRNTSAVFLVLIARREALKTYLVTASLVGVKRNERRCRKFR